MLLIGRNVAMAVYVYGGGNDSRSMWTPKPRLWAPFHRFSPIYDAPGGHMPSKGLDLAEYVNNLRYLTHFLQRAAPPPAAPDERRAAGP